MTYHLDRARFPIHKSIEIALEWNALTDPSARKIDLDLYAIGLNGENRLFSPEYFVSPHHPGRNRSITHKRGDSTSVSSHGSAGEAIDIQLDMVDAGVERIILPVNIYGASRRGQNLQSIGEVNFRVVDTSSGAGSQIFHSDLSLRAELADTAMVVGELNRETRDDKEDRWYFCTLFAGYPSLGVTLMEYRVI
ncbi:TerD family protein [Streptomyces erythrochromogenes]|uniref:TerD family protein n=1 Tax=Streptomyces erythrochromogenes TaxID=285574 RepID=UPI0036C2B9E1